MTSSEMPTPDPYTNEWYREQFNKMQYHWNRSMTEEVTLQQRCGLLHKEVREMQEQRAKDMAKIGELQERMQQMQEQMLLMQERLENAAKVVAELKKATKQGKANE